MRPTSDRYFLDMAALVSTRATCARRLVGCVLVNQRKHVIATGYNGVPVGFAHCRDSMFKCEGATAPSGTSLDLCHAIHAECNALLQCHDVWQIHTAYVTASPCVNCLKMFLNTSCERIVFSEEYPQPAARMLWQEAGREWIYGAEIP